MAMKGLNNLRTKARKALEKQALEIQSRNPEGAELLRKDARHIENWGREAAEGWLVWGYIQFMRHFYLSLSLSPSLVVFAALQYCSAWCFLVRVFVLLLCLVHHGRGMHVVAACLAACLTVPVSLSLSLRG